jgi:APA family basic amino acid/polyamine antiporter
MIKQKYTRSVAINMVIANMIGTGIFTSLGYQVLPESMGGIPDPFAILVIWVLGGVISLCGATVYGEIASTINKSGGEYAFLSELYHPLLGFISGWVSMLVGFSAAIGALALAAGTYFLPLLGMSSDDVVLGIPIVKFVATIMIGLVVLVHVRGIRFGGVFQNYMTYVKLGLIVVFLLIPFLFIGNYDASSISFAPTSKSWETIFSVPFAGALVWVFFAYSGWNASAYIVGSLENPKKNLPYSLIVGTIVVTILYLLLNFVFMYVASFDELAGNTDLGNVVANKVLGPEVGLVFSAVFSVALISGLSAMFIAGPRVIQEMGKDHQLFKVLGRQTEEGAPRIAIFVMMFFSLMLVYFLDFNQIIQFTGVTLAIFSLLTVIGIFILRMKKISNEHTVRAWGYPFTPIIFIAVVVWMIYYFLSMQPDVILWFIVLIEPAIILYYISDSMKKKSDSTT